MTLFDEFKNIINKELVDSSFLVPLLIWTSGSQKNIENSQKINKLFFKVDKNILTHLLVINNNIHHIIKYPKVIKNDKKLDFFYKDICIYFNWSFRELQKNLSVINIDNLKPVIAKSFGYNIQQRKLLKLPKLNCKKNKQ